MGNVRGDFIGMLWFCIFMPLLFTFCGILLVRMAEYCFTPITMLGSYTPAFTPGAVLVFFLIPGYTVSFCVAIHYFKKRP